jgi:hypothetical protein
MVATCHSSGLVTDGLAALAAARCAPRSLGLPAMLTR